MQSYSDKRDPPTTNKVLSPHDALVYWITMLQTWDQYRGEVGSLMVKGMDDSEDPYTEIDIHNDDPTNLVDGTWTEPILIPASEDEQ